jgi:hypothetical protein
MKVLKALLLLAGSFALALVGGVVAGSAYQHWRYPGVQDTDGLLDIGAAFGAGFAAVTVVLIAVFLVRRSRQRRV